MKSQRQRLPTSQKALLGSQGFNHYLSVAANDEDVCSDRDRQRQSDWETINVVRGKAAAVRRDIKPSQCIHSENHTFIFQKMVFSPHNRYRLTPSAVSPGTSQTDGTKSVRIETLAMQGNINEMITL